MELVTRPRVRDDDAFIFKSWLESYRHSGMVRHVENDAYYSGHRKLIERALTEGTTLVACNSDDDQHLFGYFCFQAPNVAHYVYTKRAFWRLGVARHLVEASGLNLNKPVVATHWLSLCEKVNPRLQYDPYLLLR